ncbi:MAG: integral rane sensor signal transduction histidine kinase [Deferribacteraceae bacterium]|jgi:two-component system sensor histidine kinase HydH|nr:integral rane sensor signal transduction histidine kinase [Deferribacteraceae bacterium]
MNIFKQVRLLLFAAIFLNLILIFSYVSSANRNLQHFKAHLHEYANFIMKTLEGGNRVFMMQMGYSRNNFRLLANELAKNENVKNLIVTDSQNEIIFSLSTPDDYQQNLLEKNIFETKNELVFKRVIKFNPSRWRMGMMSPPELSASNISLTAYLIMDLSGYNKIKREIYFNIFFTVLSEVLLILIAVFLFKIFKSYIKTQEDLKRAEKEAELGKFANILAHEIKNPLSSMKGLVEYTVKKESDEKLKDYLSRSLTEIDRLNKIVNDFLDFGRHIRLSTKLLDIGHLINRAVDILKYDLNDKTLTIEVLGESFQINGDEDKIFQVLINLFLNAISASPVGDKIIARLDANIKKITIINNVVNMDFDKNKIFEPFYTTKAKGSGLGLAISKKIIELHGGKVEVENIYPFTISVNFEGKNG